MKNKILELKGVSVGYEGKGNILNDICLTVYENDFLGIIGPNGGGKTTLIKTILGLIPYNQGSLKFYKNGKEINKLNIGYLPQINQIDRNFPISVFDTILSGLETKRKLFFNYNAQQRKLVKQLAESLEITSFLNKPIGKLSGGQLQRVLLGRAIISQPEILILDEPNTFIDRNFQSLLYKFLEEINKKTAIIMVSHDIEGVLSIVKNIACVNGSIHYHSGIEISDNWIANAFNCPIDIINHAKIPQRTLHNNASCDCGKE